MDDFRDYSSGIGSPVTRALAITPSDAAALDFRPRALFVGSGGSLTLRLPDDAADSVWSNIPDGTLLPVRPIAVRATGTTATGILALG
ncbi:spike base protein, RCAP_Rcc01079 family [Sphingomonas immobilis]|uniref:Uncharacterized protein n=1 Tax=Sphingomonas immobilis TaxID=3063997 RepID=A0ABT9A436_9SPHN|nr:hypothetical protein [Sphingomonas sp. CA1-15]MDO7844606.1 hypothetical protein [Sphingomonas sp. CA1-15]